MVVASTQYGRAPVLKLGRYGRDALVVDTCMWIAAGGCRICEKRVLVQDWAANGQGRMAFERKRDLEAVTKELGNCCCCSCRGYWVISEVRAPLYGAAAASEGGRRDLARSG